MNSVGKMQSTRGKIIFTGQNQVQTVEEEPLAAPGPGEIQVQTTRTLISTGTEQWLASPLQQDQELDSRRSTGAVYWEGAVTVTRDGKPAVRGYLDLTGYVRPMKL